MSSDRSNYAPRADHFKEISANTGKKVTIFSDEDSDALLKIFRVIYISFHNRRTKTALDFPSVLIKISKGMEPGFHFLRGRRNLAPLKHNMIHRKFHWQ